MADAVPAGGRIEDLLRTLAPQVLGVLARRYGQFDACEDAAQEALLEAALTWPAGGTGAKRPSPPRFRRCRHSMMSATPGRWGTPMTPSRCCTSACHPALSPPSQLALTLRAVGGLTTAEIASAFLVPEATMAQRISRAKQGIVKAGARFEAPAPDQLQARTAVVQQVLYLIFNEGYAASSGPSMQRSDLTAEAIRLSRLLLRILPPSSPGRGEAAGLLALMLLTEARREARTLPDGSLVPFAEQDRGLWDAALVREGVSLLTSVLGKGPVGPYQLQAAIAAVHDEALTSSDTDWPQILALYEVLEGVAPSPVVTLNRAVAVAMVNGPLAGLAVLGTLDHDGRMANGHRLDAVRGHLLELSGDLPAARAAYLRAASATANLPERRYLALRAGRLT